MSLRSILSNLRTYSLMPERAEEDLTLIFTDAKLCPNFLNLRTPDLKVGVTGVEEEATAVVAAAVMEAEVAVATEVEVEEAMEEEADLEVDTAEEVVEDTEAVEDQATDFVSQTSHLSLLTFLNVLESKICSSKLINQTV